MCNAQIYFWYGNAATRTFGRAHRRRPYGFVWWITCGTVDVVWGRLRVDVRPYGFRLGGLRVGQLVSFEKEIWPSTIFSCFDFPSTGKHDFAAPRNRLNHAPFGLEDGIDGREKHRKNGDIDAQHHQLIPKNGMQEGQNTRRKMPGNAIQRRPGDG